MKRLVFACLVAVIGLAPALAAAQAGGGGAGGAGSGGGTPGASTPGSSAGDATTGSGSPGSTTGSVPSTDSPASASPSTDRTPAQFTTKGDCERAGGTWHRFTQKCEMGKKAR